MITRVVMVEFHPHATPAQIDAFKAGLHELAAQAAGLLRMSCGDHEEAGGDTVLRQKAPTVTFGSFLSIWEFQDSAALEEFLVDPAHRLLADQWRAAVKHRYVVNMR
jgi:Stress responsive A/B Barrel Domain